MGNHSKKIKQKTKEHPDVLPYNNLNKLDLDFEKLIDLAQHDADAELKKYYTNLNLETEKNFVPIKEDDIKINENNIENSEDYVNMLEIYEKHLREPEKKYLWKQYLNYSSDGIISNRQFWTFLDLGNIYNTTFAKMFYKAACNFKENNKLDHLKFMDHTKFIQFVTIFTKNGPLIPENKNSETLESLRLKFIFKIFDVDNSEELDRLEFRNILTSFVEMLLICKFESKVIQEKVDILLGESKNTQMIEKILDLYCDEIFTRSFNQDYLTYDEWEAWFKSIKGIDKMLDFNGYLKYS